jgi:hypothetical protein
VTCRWGWDPEGMGFLKFPLRQSPSSQFESTKLLPADDTASHHNHSGMMMMISPITTPGFATLQKLNQAHSVGVVNRKIRCYGPTVHTQL